MIGSILFYVVAVPLFGALLYVIGCSRARGDGGLPLATEPRCTRRRILIGAGIAVTLTAPTLASGALSPAYRYTGWVAPTPQASPQHLVVDGDNPVLRFADAYPGKAPVVYRVCVQRAGSSVKSCQRGTAPTTTLPSTLPLKVLCCGTFVARWTVGGQTVATWRFLYKRE